MYGTKWRVGALFAIASVLLGWGCAGALFSGGPTGERLSNAEVVLVSFGSVQGELLECG